MKRDHHHHHHHHQIVPISRDEICLKKVDVKKCAFPFEVIHCRAFRCRLEGFAARTICRETTFQHVSTQSTKSTPHATIPEFDGLKGATEPETAEVHGSVVRVESLDGDGDIAKIAMFFGGTSLHSDFLHVSTPILDFIYSHCLCYPSN